jgi:hypothetical protein
VITTDNEVLLNNTRELLPIICEQKTVEKKVISEKLLKDANKNGFGNDVGSVTNKCTGMFDVLASFEEGTEEYNEMLKRIICMQGYQQEVIDSVKGCIAKEVPKHWYSYTDLKIKNNDTEEVKEWKTQQLKLASYKKPYFFIYNYKHVMNKYNQYIKNSNTNALIRFGLTLEELKQKEDKTQDEIDFLSYFELLMPVFKHKSTMNRICWALEYKFKDLKLNVKSDENFDISILKSEDNKYTKLIQQEIKDLYSEYKLCVKQYMVTSKELKAQEKRQQRFVFINKYKQKAYEICSNKYILCNALVDTCYKSTDSKQFVWDICGDVILENLLKKSNNTMNYPITTDIDSEFIWNGNGYKMITQGINEGDDVSI